MDDFEEICEELILTGGAVRVADEAELVEILDTFLQDKDLRLQHGRAALGCVLNNRGVIEKHVQLIRENM